MDILDFFGMAFGKSSSWISRMAFGKSSAFKLGTLQELEIVPGRGVLGLDSVVQRFFVERLSRGLDRSLPEYEVIHKDFSNL